jgi:hypothetical protein
VGEQAETYLRLVAEKELRRALPRPAGPDDSLMSSPDIPGRAMWTLRRTGQILVAAGALDEELVDRLGREIEAAFTVRSRRRLNRHGFVSFMFERFPGSAPRRSPPPGQAAQPMRIVPLGQTFRIVSERAPADLHFLSLAATPDEATIAVVMRMHWPPDGSSTDLEVTGAGYHHLPYDRLELADDRGTRCPVAFDGEGGTATWRGVARMAPAPTPKARWLDLIADGTERLIRLDLRPGARARVHAAGVAEEELRTSPAERLLAVAAETVLVSSWDRRAHTMDPDLGEITAALTQAGLIAADSPALGRLAALCQRLGVPGPGITAPAAGLPARWASVLAQRPADTAGPEMFAPLATILPDLERTRFALAGLSVAAGESFLHVTASGMPQLAERFGHGWQPGFSWWVRDGAGAWHIAVIAEPSGRPAGDTTLRLRLIPPLTAPQDTIEVQVDAGSARVRAVLPVHGGPGIADT